MELVRKFGPYLAVELFLPGGTLLAVALYFYRKNSRRDVDPTPLHSTIGQGKGINPW
jgi:hypothetical protein